MTFLRGHGSRRPSAAVRRVGTSAATLVVALALSGLALPACSRGPVESALPRTAPAELRADAARCDEGDALACVNVGGALAEGSGVEPDVAAGVALAERGCDGGALLGCVSAARFVEDASRAVELLRRACDGGFAGGCVALGNRLAADAPADALAAWSGGCDGGIVSGCYAVGMAHLHGVGVVASETRAIEVLTAACGHGSSEACRESGRIASASDDPDEKRHALPLLQRACGGLDGEACALAAGLMSADGGDPVEAAAAPSFLRRACELGWVAACDAPR